MKPKYELKLIIKEKKKKKKNKNKNKKHMELFRNGAKIIFARSRFSQN